MKKAYILIFKRSLQISGYSSLVALVEDNLRADIKVGIRTLRNIKFNNGEFYENRYIFIHKIPIKTSGDVRINRMA